jgi:hypothetical protein
MPEKMPMGEIDPEKLMSVLDAQDTARDQMYAEQAPVGRFSAPRINALCKEVNKVLKLIKAPYEAEQIEGPLKDKTPLPPGLMKGLTLVKSMIEDYNEEADAPLKSFEITQLTDDAALALAGVAITELLRSPDFKAFLKENAPEEEGVEVEVKVEAPLERAPAEAGMPGSPASEMALLS